MNQHELVGSIYVHKLHLHEQALSYCDQVYNVGLHQRNSKSGWSTLKTKGRGLGQKIAQIEGAEGTRINTSIPDSGKSDIETNDPVEVLDVQCTEPEVGPGPWSKSLETLA